LQRSSLRGSGEKSIFVRQSHILILSCLYN
jgi:hypothetical protein